MVKFMVMAISSEALMRTCSKCRVEKPESEFYFKPSKGAFESRCKPCIKSDNLAYYEKNKDKVKKTNSEYRDSVKHTDEYRRKSRAYHASRHRELKIAALERIGMVCACCGESDIAFLTIDHVENDGHIHRKAINHVSVYAWLKQNDYECDHKLQTLCFNCNFAKRYNGGACPHKERSETIRKEYASSEVEAPSPCKG